MKSELGVKIKILLMLSYSLNKQNSIFGCLFYFKFTVQLTTYIATYSNQNPDIQFFCPTYM